MYTSLTFLADTEEGRRAEKKNYRSKVFRTFVSCLQLWPRHVGATWSGLVQVAGGTTGPVHHRTSRATPTLTPTAGRFAMNHCRVTALPALSALLLTHACASQIPSITIIMHSVGQSRCVVQVSPHVQCRSVLMCKLVFLYSVGQPGCIVSIGPDV